MWAHRGWVGRHLPVATPPGGELEPYARLCNAVEGNTTFYALPTDEAVDRWRESADDGFRFVCKLPREITHERRLRVDGEPLTTAIDRLTRLGDRLGPISIQLPPSFGPDDLGALESFLAAVPKDLPWAVEVRHPAFHDGSDDQRHLDELLHRTGTDRIIIDTRALFAGPCETPEEIEAFERKPSLVVRPIATGWQPIVRIIGQRDLDETESFWEPWIAKVSEWLTEGRSPIVFLHTPDNLDAPLLARRFHAAVVARVPTLDPLPEPLPVRDQLDLF
jgi:uncharacterized protein YecE (DUF72 family)